MKHSEGLGEPQRQERQKRNHFSARINMFFFATFVVFSVLIIRLAILQFVEGQELSELENQSTKRTITISPIRGNIYDLKGAPIASTISAQSLFYRVEPGQKSEDKIALARNLEKIFTDLNGGELILPAADIIKNMDVGIDIDGNKTKDPSYTFLPRRIKSRLTKDELAYFAEHRDELKGLEITEESTRIYDDDQIAVQLVGYLRPYNVARNQKATYLNVYKDKQGEYLNDEYVGFDGLEFLYQDELRGKNGTKSYPVNAQAQIIGQVEITPPEKGHNLHLTIEKSIQEAAEKGIVDQLAYMKSADARAKQYPAIGKNAVSGYAVAMEVNTGRVVAMASMPDYNSNVWTGGISTAKLEEIQYRYTNGTIMERLPDIHDNKERGKHPTSLVPLGSTIKPLSVLLGLNEGLISVNERYNDPTTFFFGREGYKVGVSNSDKANYGVLTPSRALEKSSNTFMAEMIGDRLYKSSKYPPFDKKNPDADNGNAIKIWDSYMKKFGLGVKTGSGLPGEYEGDIYYYNSAVKESTQSALIYASFGQQGRYTTLQLAQYASMLANRGKRYKPQFVDKVTTYEGDTVRTLEPELLNQEDIPAAYWNVLEKGMKEVFIQGFDGVSYSVVRKTGTSQQQVAGQTIDNAVFIAYAPADKPKLAVAVVVPEGGFGSWGAAPIARHIFDAYDQAIGLYDK
ncbi:peptidoglycan D,D-transpeptidase FtsI family protein [Paenibacillus sp. MBLB4367]|uniref:peptidoglycan D,D-transpeptidase FtsI family protein n=1 Tax=Paenibacillus sp. MBLB4367 TaxID=3384767 RepID=UPI0039081737